VAPIWRVSIGYVAFFTAVGAAWPYLPIYYRHLGLSLAAIGSLAALSAGIQLIAAPAWGGIADRFPRTRLTLPAAALIAVAGASILATGRDLPTIAAGVTILAAGLSGVGPILDARAIETLGPDRVRYGQVRAVGSAAFVAVAWGVGLLLDARGIEALFVVYIPALLVTALVSATLVRRPSTRAVGVLRGALGYVRGPGMRLFLVGTFLVWTSLIAVNSFLSIRIAALGGADQTVGLMWAIGAAVEVPVMWFFPRLASRFGAGRPLIVGAFLFGIRAALSAAATDPLVLLAVAPIEGTAFALFYVGGVTFMAERAPAGFTATAQGLFAAVSGSASIVGSALGGLIAGAISIPGLFATCAAASLVAALVVAIAVARAGRPAHELAVAAVAAADPTEVIP
jgi:PPP family 3-phenylpropionic acid transporter